MVVYQLELHVVHEIGDGRMRTVARPGIEVLRTRIKTPWANAIYERFTLRVPRSVRRECLDHILLVREAQLRRDHKEYVTYFNRMQPHQGIDQRMPEGEDRSGPSLASSGKVIGLPVLGGLHHEYRRVA
jgi:hypothetical protein